MEKLIEKLGTLSIVFVIMYGFLLFIIVTSPKVASHPDSLIDTTKYVAPDFDPNFDTIVFVKMYDGKVIDAIVFVKVYDGKVIDTKLLFSSDNANLDSLAISRAYKLDFNNESGEFGVVFYLNEEEDK